MTTSLIFATVLFMGFTCSFGCGTVTTPFMLGSLLGDGRTIEESRRAITMFSVGKVVSLMVMGLLAAIFGNIVLTSVEQIYPDLTIWIIRILTAFFGIKILYQTIKQDFLPTKGQEEASSCSSCSGCSKSKAMTCGGDSAEGIGKIPKSYFLAGLLYATIPCGPLLTTLTYASTMNILVAVLLLGLFGIVNSIVPVFFFASLVGMANSEFEKTSKKFLKYIKLSGGVILLYAAIYKV